MNPNCRTWPIFCLVPACDRLVKHHCVQFHAPCFWQMTFSLRQSPGFLIVFKQWHDICTFWVVANVIYIGMSKNFHTWYASSKQSFTDIYVFIKLCSSFTSLPTIVSWKCTKFAQIYVYLTRGWVVSRCFYFAARAYNRNPEIHDSLKSSRAS